MKSSNLRLGIGTGGGTLLSALSVIGAHDVLRTAALAAVGAVVSFLVSWLLNQWHKRR